MYTFLLNKRKRTALNSSADRIELTPSTTFGLDCRSCDGFNGFCPLYTGGKLIYVQCIYSLSIREQCEIFLLCSEVH